MHILSLAMCIPRQLSIIRRTMCTVKEWQMQDLPNKTNLECIGVHITPNDTTYSIQEPKKVMPDPIPDMLLIICISKEKQLLSNFQFMQSMKYHGICFGITLHMSNCQIGENFWPVMCGLSDSHHICEQPTTIYNLKLQGHTHILPILHNNEFLIHMNKTTVIFIQINQT